MILFVESGCPICTEAAALAAHLPVTVHNVGTVDGLAEFYALSPGSDQMPLFVADTGAQFKGMAAVDEIRRLAATHASVEPEA
jgi:hypothetical protein